MDTSTLVSFIDLRALAEEAGARFHGNSSHCPLHHGNNPSAFRIYQGRDGRWRWHCFTNCPEGANGGDAISFYMQWRQVDFRTAVRELAQRVGLPLDVPRSASLRPATPPPTPPPGTKWSTRAREFIDYAQDRLWSDVGAPVRKYLHQERGLTDETIRAWGMGFNPRDIRDRPERWGLEGKKIWLPRGVVIPGERDGMVWYVKVRRPLPGDALARVLGPVKELPNVKFSGPRGGRGTLWGADRVRGIPILLLTEGEWDGLLAWQEVGGLCDVVAQGGASRRLTMADSLTLAGAMTVLVVYDADEAGERGVEHFRSLRRVRAVTPPAHDLVDYYRKGGNVGVWIADLIAREMERLLNRIDAQRQAEKFVAWLELYEKAVERCRQR